MEKVPIVVSTVSTMGRDVPALYKICDVKTSKVIGTGIKVVMSDNVAIPKIELSVVMLSSGIVCANIAPKIPPMTMSGNVRLTINHKLLM